MDIETGPYGIGGNTIAKARIDFHGLLGDNFVQFVRKRAGRLNLSGSLHAERGHVTVFLAGAAPLIDAFEMACILGPIDADVEAWDRSDLEADVLSAGDMLV